MYKKLKATKNNSLKKASIIMTVAIVASCVMLSDPERFGAGDEPTVSAMGRFDWFNRPRSFSAGYGPRGLRGLGRYGYDGLWGDPSGIDSKSSLSENQAEIFEEQQFIMGKISESMRQLLSMVNMAGTAKAVMDSAADEGRVEATITAMFKSLSRSKPYNKIVTAQRGLGPTRTLQNYDKVCLSLGVFQNYIWELLLQFAALLDVDRFNDSEDINTAAREISKDVKLNKNVIAVSGLQAIKADSALKLQASSIASEAISLFLKGKTFDGGTSLNVSDDWGSYAYRGRLYSSDYSPAILQFKNALNVLLHVNTCINKVNSIIVAYRWALYVAQTMRAMAIQGGDDTTFALGERSGLSIGWYKRGLGELVALPALLIDLSGERSSGVLQFNGAESIEYNTAEFVKSVSKCFSDKAVKPSDAFDTLYNYAQRHVPTGLNLEYDLTAVFQNILGSTNAKELFGRLDELHLQLINPKAQTAFKAQPQISKDTNDFIARAYKRYEADDPEMRFVSRGGNLNPVTFDANLDNYNASFLAKMLAMPKTLRLRALLNVCADEAARNSGSKGYWGDTLSTSFIDGAISACGKEFMTKLSDVLGRAKNIVEKVHSIKKEAKKSKRKGKPSSSKGQDTAISNLCVLYGDNSVCTSIQATPAEDGNGDLSISFKGLSRHIGKVWPALIEKLPSGATKTQDPLIDLPVVDVQGDTVVVNLAGKLNNVGQYELHLRDVTGKLDAAGKPTTSDFIVKSKFYYGAGKLKIAKELTSLKKEQETGSCFDYSTAQVFKLKNDALRFVLKLKDGVEELPKGTIGIYFNQGAPANMERDTYGLTKMKSLGNGYYSFTTRAKQEGAKQFHIYRGNVGEKNYDGKILCSTSDTKDYINPAKQSEDFARIVAKKDYLSSDLEDSGASTIEKNLKFSVLEDQFINPPKNDTKLEYSIINSKGEVVLTDRSPISGLTVSEGKDYYNALYGYGLDTPSRYKFNMTVKLPDDGDEKNYRVRIDDNSFINVIQTESNLNKNTENGTEFKLKVKGNDYFYDDFDYDDD